MMREESRNRLFSFTQNQEEIHISELDLLTIGTVLDMYTELQRDDEPHDQLASQDDFDRF